MKRKLQICGVCGFKSNHPGAFGRHLKMHAQTPPAKKEKVDLNKFAVPPRGEPGVGKSVKFPSPRDFLNAVKDVPDNATLHFQQSANSDGIRLLVHRIEDLSTEVSRLATLVHTQNDDIQELFGKCNELATNAEDKREGSTTANILEYVIVFTHKDTGEVLFVNGPYESRMSANNTAGWLIEHVYKKAAFTVQTMTK